MRRQSPERQTILQTMADQRWHTLGNLFAVCAEYIDPERAARAYIRTEYPKYQNKLRASDPSTLPAEHRVEIGRRIIIREIISDLLRRKIITSDGRGMSARYHANKCQTCGSQTLQEPNANGHVLETYINEYGTTVILCYDFSAFPTIQEVAAFEWKGNTPC